MAVINFLQSLFWNFVNTLIQFFVCYLIAWKIEDIVVKDGIIKKNIITVSLPTVNMQNLRGWISFSYRFISPVRRESPETQILNGDLFYSLILKVKTLEVNVLC